MLSPNQQVKQLTKKFGLRMRRMSIIQKGVYKITTPQGKQFSLKRMSYPRSRIRWIDKTLKQMIKKDPKIRIGWRHYGTKLYVKRCKNCPPFMLIPWINGTWPSPNSIKQMKACGTLVARFHRAGQRINITAKGQHRTNGTWIAYLRTEQRRLEAAIRKAKRNGYRSPLDRLLRKHGQEISQMGKRSIRALNKNRYRKLSKKSKLTLCHGDFGPTNLIRTNKGMHIIDFETLRMDLRAYDLYKAIFNFCQCNDWSFTKAKAFLDGYQKISKLNRTDIKLLKSLLRFPRGICKFIRHYSKKSAKGKRRIEQEFPIILKHERKRSAFLRKLDSYLR